MKYIAYIFIFFCFYPYINIFNLGTDTQPNALIAGSILLFTLNKKKLNTPIILFWVLFILSIFLYFKSTVTFFEYLKNILNYLSIPLTCTTTYALYKFYNLKVSFRLFTVIITTYGIVGLAQIYIDPDFLTFLLNESGRGVLIGGRGSISLTPEPAFYGTICWFFMSFALLSYSKRENIITAINLILQVLFVARSSTALMILAVSIFFFLAVQFLRFKMKYVLLTCLALAIVIPIGNNILEKLEETRMGDVVNGIIEDPLLITHIDLSVGTRFTGAVSPYFAFKHNYGLPMGIGSYKPFLKKLYTKGLYRSMLTTGIINMEDRLTGSMNMVLFQLGFIGLLMPIAIFLCFKDKLGNDGVLFAMILLITILFTQIQMMHSMIGFILATALYTPESQSESKLQTS